MLLGLLYRIIGDYFSYIGDIGGTTGWTKKNVSLLQTKTLGTSYSETTNL